MENIRQRLLAQNADLYPDAISSSSSSSTSSTGPLPVNSRKPVTIILSSDEEDELEGTKTLPLKPSNFNQQSQSSLPSKPKSAQSSLGRPKKTVVNPPAAFFGGIQPPRPTPPASLPDEDELKDGEEVVVPDFQDEEHRYISPADAEKALRDLMGGAMNQDVDLDPEDTVVDGFKEEFTLLPHQVIGRSWMKSREDPKLKRMGGILADDMGLGKTIQTLTRICEGKPRKSDKEDGWDPATLVVCPLALVGQWADEIERMTEGLKVVKHQGTARTSDPKVLRRAHVVITTYDTLKSEFGAFNPAEGKPKAKANSKKVASSEDDSDSEAEYFGRSLKKNAPKKKSTKAKKEALFHIQWFRVILDEAHNIKNKTTAAAKACYALEAKFRWALTGTPMQNDVAELYSLLKFLRIKPFNAWERFNEQIAKPVKSGKGANRAMKRLQVVLKQVMLRRRKDDTVNGKVLIELPPRIVNIISCPFSPSEQQFYNNLESKMSDVMEKLVEDANKAGQKANYMSVLLLLLRLRQACNHPSLVSKDYKEDLDAVDSRAAKKNSADVDADDLVAAFDQLNVSKKVQSMHYRVCFHSLTSVNTANKTLDGHCDDCAIIAIKSREQSRDRPASAKIRKLLDILLEVGARSDGTEKTIIFSQFTTMLDLIEPFLKENGIKFVRYDGSMKPLEREKSLETIKTQERIKGLNLTACNNDQAFDRSHRFGQKRDVNIYKLKIDNTVEDRILEVSLFFDSGDKIKNLHLGMDELLALFRPSHGGDSDEE
ncbi:hypothetical protein BT96DRAFT_915973 [Gymnopus androsaceus JB14]|uniref:Helicase ATP-binding domain-containing protein n=1 Tax=Gymnopus androsaceus JB14 TaxID=1447944 RepID=A0A6A4I4S9_9AGAR|nr:hypothetical protein BT96DRAFT_915973 [Gymnopus androsaceus JB14]